LVYSLTRSILSKRVNNPSKVELSQSHRFDDISQRNVGKSNGLTYIAHLYLLSGTQAAAKTSGPGSTQRRVYRTQPQHIVQRYLAVGVHKYVVFICVCVLSHLIITLENVSIVAKYVIFATCQVARTSLLSNLEHFPLPPLTWATAASRISTSTTDLPRPGCVPSIPTPRTRLPLLLPLLLWRLRRLPLLLPLPFPRVPRFRGMRRMRTRPPLRFTSLTRLLCPPGRLQYSST
jgi:hypothetical protein